MQVSSFDLGLLDRRIDSMRRELEGLDPADAQYETLSRGLIAAMQARESLRTSG